MSVTDIVNSILPVSSKGVVYIPSLHIWNKLPFIIDMNGTIYTPTVEEVITQQIWCDKMPEECVLCALDKSEFYNTACCGNVCCVTCLDTWYRRTPSCPFCRNTTTFIHGCK